MKTLKLIALFKARIAGLKSCLKEENSAQRQFADMCEVKTKNDVIKARIGEAEMLLRMIEEDIVNSN